MVFTVHLQDFMNYSLQQIENSGKFYPIPLHLYYHPYILHEVPNLPLYIRESQSRNTLEKFN